MNSAGFGERPVLRFPENVFGVDQVAVEEPLEIRIDGEPLAVTMRTPGHDIELAAGFCFTEGIIEEADQLERVEPCAVADYGNVVLVTLSADARQRRTAAIAAARREFYLSSSCGLCGTRTIDRIEKRIAAVECTFAISTATLVELPFRMAKAQTVFASTGGLHAATLFTPGGELCLLCEDVGRHNAVDKVVGALLLSGQLPASNGILLVSGRASFELIQKAARAGIGFFASVGAPSSLAVEAAKRFGMTLVGFLRDGRFNVYSNGERIETRA